jgi:hypothetical protein
MNTSSLSTPILFLVFARPDVTKSVFDAIRAARPQRLYVAADGPRVGKEGEASRCEETRRIATNVDWPCEVKTLFRDENLGCGSAVSQAITWFFTYETEGIILEDDCLPAQSFFPFCSEILERYRHDKRVMEIGGNNFLDPGDRENEYSYIFSNNNYIWGWATWKRVWDLYEYDPTRFREIKRKHYLKNLFHSIYEWHYFKWEFDRVFVPGRKSVWSYQLEFIRRINSGLTVVPGKNLVINVGFGEGATHTDKKDRMDFKWVLEEIEFPLKHPEYILPDKQRDIQTFNRVYTSRSSRIRAQLVKFIPEGLLKKVVRPVWRTLSFSRLSLFLLPIVLAS